MKTENDKSRLQLQSKKNSQRVDIEITTPMVPSIGKGSSNMTVLKNQRNNPEKFYSNEFNLQNTKTEIDSDFRSQI